MRPLDIPMSPDVETDTRGEDLLHRIQQAGLRISRLANELENSTREDYCQSDPSNSSVFYERTEFDFDQGTVNEWGEVITPKKDDSDPHR